MRIVGSDFRDGILYVPEVLLAADAYCRDAAVAVETAKGFMAKRQGSAFAKK